MCLLTSFLYLLICLPYSLSTYTVIYLSINLSFFASVYLHRSIDLSFYLQAYLSTLPPFILSLSMYLTIYLFVHLSIFASIYLHRPICLSIYPPFHPFISISIYLPINLPFSAYVHLHLSLYQSIYLSTSTSIFLYPCKLRASPSFLPAALVVSSPPHDLIYSGVWGYNGFLAAGAMVFFVVPGPRVVLLAVLNAVLATFTQAAITPVFAQVSDGRGQGKEGKLLGWHSQALHFNYFQTSNIRSVEFY